MRKPKAFWRHSTTPHGDLMNTKKHRDFGCPPIPADARSTLDSALVEFIDYRKTGLSLNHLVGCPLGCAYCVRHLFGAFDFTRPQRLVDDAEAIDALIKHRFFREHITPLQLFNRATDPFLPRVKDHTFNVLRLLDEHGLKNHIAVITRHHVTDDDCRFLNTLQNLRLTLFITYSGISDPRIEPVDSGVAERSLKTAFENARRYRVILYWRPIMPGVNDSPGHVRAVSDLSRFAHATAFTGVFFRKEMDQYFRENGIPGPFDRTARRKILPKETEAQLLRLFGGQSLFRKSSCAACFAHGIPDYNGHYGIQELCDGCPPDQKERCRLAHAQPDRETIDRLAQSAGLAPYDIEIGANAVRLSGLDEQGRYYLQHNTNFQVHDRHYEHKIGRHGRAEIGWSDDS